MTEATTTTSSAAAAVEASPAVSTHSDVSASVSVTSNTSGPKKYKRVWVDGCFDMMHYGHANALRQAKELCEYLVVGVHSDAEIMHNKGIPVMNERERYEAVRSCKWVDVVVENAPYVTTLEIMDEYGCEVCVHGDDLSIGADGKDTYQLVKDAGRFVECRRTQGVSTTELVGRMLLMSKAEDVSAAASAAAASDDDANSNKRARVENFAGRNPKSPYTSGVSHFLTTSHRLLQFSNGKEPQPGDRVVYVDGGFDLYHLGHIEFLKEAKKLGDYLLVGVHDDATIRRVLGSSFPLMNLNERVLSVLSCRYVDEVIIGAPYSVTKDVLEKVYKVSVVAHGPAPAHLDEHDQDPYKLPKELGIYREINHDYSFLTYNTIIQRIMANRFAYEERNRKKEAKELAALEAQRQKHVVGAEGETVKE